MLNWAHVGLRRRPTPPEAHKISNLTHVLGGFARAKVLLVVLIFGLLFSACESTSRVNRISDAIEKSVYTRVYFSNYESVWRAAQLALKYPIAVNNMDNGLLETDWIRALEGFSPPGDSRIPSSGIRYKISVNMVKGRVGGRESVRLSLRKIQEKQRDFFADPEQMLSDGVEEKVLLYRIERELIIQDALKKIPDQ